MLFCSETQSWCVIEQKAQHFVLTIAEKRDQTNRTKITKKVFTPRTEWGSKYFWQRINSRILGQIFVRSFCGKNPELGGA